MATHVKKIQTVDCDLEAKPGVLAKIYSAFKEAGVNVIASWAYEMGPGQGKAHFYTTDNNKTKEVLAKVGRKPVFGEACYAEGDDRVGNYAELLTKIANAGVNVGATDAFGISGKFATVFFAEDCKNLCKALGV